MFHREGKNSHWLGAGGGSMRGCRHLSVAVILCFWTPVMWAETRRMRIVWDHDQQQTDYYLVQVSNQPDPTKRGKWATIRLVPAVQLPTDTQPLSIQLPGNRQYVVVFAVSSGNPKVWSKPSNVIHVP